MAIDEKLLLEERKVLENDFNTTKERLAQVDKDRDNMKNNLNALFGAIQQVDKWLELMKPADKEEVKDLRMPAEKEKALNLATS